MGVRTVFAPIAITPELLKRFWEKTELLPSGCVRWTGFVDPVRGGFFRLNNRQVSAHIVAWRLANRGKNVPPGQNVSRTCGNVACVNVDHMELISDSEIAIRANRSRGRVIKSDTAKLTPKPIIIAPQPKAAKVTYVWKCLGCGAYNRRDSLRVTASAAACGCGVYCQTRNMQQEVER